MRELSGNLEGGGRSFALVVARFNEVVTEELLSGALETLGSHGVSPDRIEVVRVPGAWELPQACARLAGRDDLDGIVALGCVIRGETPHFEFVAGEAARGLGAVARASSLPVIFGVLTTDTLEQALARVGNGAGHKGREAALAALEMVNLYRELP